MNVKISQSTPPQDNTQTPSSQTDTGQSDTKEIIYLAAGLLTLVIGIGGLLMYTEEEPLPATASQEIEEVQMAKAFATPDSQSKISDPVEFSPVPAEEPLTYPVSPITNASDSQPLEEMNVYFMFNSSTLSDDAKEEIKTRVENKPEGWTGTLKIMGHTDVQGPDAYNKALGLKRAESVKTFLVSLDIPEDDIQAETLGKEDQVCEEQTPECFEQNRRAHVAFLPSSTPHEDALQLSMTSSSSNSSTGEKSVSSTGNSSTSPSEAESSLQEEIQEELASADSLVTVEPVP